MDPRWQLNCPNCNATLQYKSNRHWNRAKRTLKYCRHCRSDWFNKNHPFKGKELPKLQGAHYKKSSILHGQWANDVKERDNRTCRECGSNEQLHAHHLFPRSVFPELRYHLNNGVTLCAPCHKNIHKDIKLTYWKSVRKGEK